MKKKNAKYTAILISLVMLLVTTWVFYHQSDATQEEPSVVSVVNTQNTLVFETAAIDNEIASRFQGIGPKYPSQNISSTEKTTEDSISRTILPSSCSIEVPFIDQNPELPTGCEITALSEVLNFWGYNVSNTELASNYLPTSSQMNKDCYINYFYGSPFSTTGSGCFSPAIITAANHYLSEQGAPLTAESLSYGDENNLFAEVAAGRPVIVWTNFDYSQEEVRYTEIQLDDDTKITWPNSEHCTVLMGYDFATNMVTLADPTYGIIERDLDQFTYYYKMFFYQAVAIRPTT